MGSDLTDVQLWRLASTGRSDAFGELFERHSRGVYNFAFRKLGDWSAAEDTVGVVFLEAWRRRDDVRFSGESVRPWLFGVAHNVCRNRWRSALRHRHALQRAAALTAEVGGHDDEVAGRLDDEARMHRVLDLLGRLPTDQRDVVNLCALSGLSYEDAAVALGVPVGTVRSRLSRARQRLTTLERELGAGGGHLLGTWPTTEEAQ